MFNELWVPAYTCGLPPSGLRGYAAAGAVGKDYLAPQHYEHHTDPLWTMGMCFDKGSADDDSYNIVMGALDNGKGLVGMNHVYSAHIWKGKDILHSGTIGMNTFNHDKATVGIVMYQKRSLLHQAQHDTHVFPSSFHMQVDREERFQPGALKWII